MGVEKGNKHAFLSLLQVWVPNCYFDVDQNCYIEVELSSGALNEKYMRAWNTCPHPGFGISRVYLFHLCRRLLRMCQTSFKLWVVPILKNTHFRLGAFTLRYESYLKLRSPCVTLHAA